MKPNAQDKEIIKEVNQHISDALEQWATILATADADEWAYCLNYSEKDVLNTILIFNSILQNVAIKNRHITENNAHEKGKAIRNAIKDFCGIDPATLIDKVYPIKNETQTS